MLVAHFCFELLFSSFFFFFHSIRAWILSESFSTQYFVLFLTCLLRCNNKVVRSCYVSGRHRYIFSAISGCLYLFFCCCCFGSCSPNTRDYRLHIEMFACLLLLRPLTFSLYSFDAVIYIKSIVAAIGLSYHIYCIQRFSAHTHTGYRSCSYIIEKTVGDY